MKRKEILVLIGEVLGSRAVYSMASLVITVTMLSGITIILRKAEIYNPMIGFYRVS